MGRVVFDISMSLDGYMAAAGQTAEEPLGHPVPCPAATLTCLRI